MSDWIDRQAAIVRTSKVIKDDGIAHDVKEALKGLPSVQPERKKGEWITLWDVADPNTSTSAKCSICGRTVWRPAGDFCRWCGADMRGDRDDST